MAGGSTMEGSGFAASREPVIQVAVVGFSFCDFQLTDNNTETYY